MKNNYGLKGPCWNKSVWITYVIVWLKRSYICCKVLKNTHCKFPTRCVCRTIWSALKVVSTGVSLFQMTHKYFMPKFGSIRQYLLVTQIDKIPHFKWNLEKLNKGEEKKLQQTSIPRLIARLPRYSHIFSYIKEHLHWLPISTRIEYKVLLIVLKAQMRVAPKYLRDAIRLLPHPFVLYAPWTGGSFLSLGLGQPWPCLDLLPLLKNVIFRAGNWWPSLYFFCIGIGNISSINSFSFGSSISSVVDLIESLIPQNKSIR